MVHTVRRTGMSFSLKNGLDEIHVIILEHKRDQAQCIVLQNMALWLGSTHRNIFSHMHAANSKAQIGTPALSDLAHTPMLQYCSVFSHPFMLRNEDIGLQVGEIRSSASPMVVHWENRMAPSLG